MPLTIALQPLGFNPRTPGGVRRIIGVDFHFQTEVSIHAPRAGCDILKCLTVMDVAVSIHAPRAGCDATASKVRNFAAVSIHAPRAGCDFVYGSIYHRQ